MGRNATFEKAEVVRAARDLFWSKNYESVSIPELEFVTGLQRSSIYHAFGSKQGLFEAVIESYFSEVLGPLLESLKGNGSGKEVIHSYLLKLQANLDSQTVPQGCLLIASANSSMCQDSAVQVAIARYFTELFTGFTRALGGDQQTARILVSLIVSSLAIARSNSDLAKQNLDQAIALLGP